MGMEEGAGAGSGATMTGQSKTQMLLEEEENIQQLQERERAMRQLESDIVDVNTIFKDLAAMVHEQGDLVDSIENNVEAAEVRVTEGTDQLRQAEQYKNQTRKRMYYLIAGLFILLIFVVFLIWISTN